MNLNFESPEVIREYLLGTLPQEQCRGLEECLITGDRLFEELLIAEDELIDEYLGGGLSEAERQHFASHFLQAPERRQKLQFAKTFGKYIESAGAGGAAETFESAAPDVSLRARLRRLFLAERPVLTLTLAAALVLLLVGVSWVIIRRSGTPERPHNSLAVTLTPRVVRDAGETKRVAIPADVGTVGLRLALPADEYQTYRAVLQSSEGAVVWTGDNLAVDAAGADRSVQCEVPAEVLGPDDYKVTLSGRLAENKFEDVAHYSFRVVR